MRVYTTELCNKCEHKDVDEHDSPCKECFAAFFDDWRNPKRKFGKFFKKEEEIMVRTCCRCHKVIRTLLDPTISVEIFHSENDTNEKFYVCQECYESLLAYLTANPEEAEAHPINDNIAKGFEEFTKMMFRQGQVEREKE